MPRARRPGSSAEAAASRFGLRNSKFELAVFTLLCLSVAGCRGTEIEDLLSNIEWFSNMRHQPAIEPFEQKPLQMPEGTVPVGGSAPVLPMPENYAERENPIEPSAESIAAGQELYRIYCSVCHGPAGRGQGSITGPAGPFPAGLVPQLVAEQAQALTDGYIFGIITVGRGLMPNYRRIPEAERWHIVNYVRELQGAGASAGEAGSDPEGAANGGPGE